ncbi:MAG: hypothetical protein ACK4RV_11845 [Caulobacter sp.]
MALGRFADINLARTAALSGGSWSPDWPLANVQDGRRYVGAPARQETPGDLAASQFDAVLLAARAVNLVAVLFHTMSLAARYRLTLASPGATLEAPTYDSGWKDVFPAVFDQAELDYEDSNWWAGQLAAEDLDLYPRHLWISLPQTLIAEQIRLEFDDADNAAGHFDIGGLWIARTWSPAFNFNRGRQPSAETRDQKEESPSGREFGDERTPRRIMTVSWSRLTDDEALRQLDAFARARTTRTVLFLPDSDNPKSLLREAYPATFQASPSPTFTYDGLNSAQAVFREIIA